MNTTTRSADPSMASSRSPSGTRDQRSDDAMVAVARRQQWQDLVFHRLTQAFSLLVLVALVGIIVSLFLNAWPTFKTFGLKFLWTVEWDIVNEQYGAAIAIVGTLLSAGIAMLFGVPLAFGIALFLTETCPVWLRRPLGTAIELLAAVPSIIYGMFGLFVFAPVFADYFQVPVRELMMGMPLIGWLFGGAPNGLGILAAGVILAFMVLPFIAAVMRDVFEITPPILRESAYGLGCTTWEVVAKVVLPYTQKGVIGGIMLGLGRALGETMAVTFVIGNANRMPTSLFSPGTSIASVLANEFGEAEGLHFNTLFALGFLLFCITFVVLALAKWMILRTEKAKGA
ncbi:MAG: phosphate ABC transporter permease subunit PstC [Hydrogenophaga sp. SCN 70-13]|nr:MAG: phosphate ABC transporter permease subunit PstC [Hydrogenophaga sp. SCN 70-13]